MLAVTETALGTCHPEYAQALNNLADLYGAEGQFAEAEPLNARSLAARERALGPVQPDVAQSLEGCADLLRATGRDDEARTMEVRAETICAKHAETNPPD